MELDKVFVFENIVVICEDTDTSSKHEKDHARTKEEAFAQKVLAKNICHGNILKCSEKARKINDFTTRQGTYYTATIPFLKEP